MSDEIIHWLLEEKNPAVKYRTQTELLHLDADNKEVKDWIFSKLPSNWYETKGLWYRYYIAALAECGLSYNDISKEQLERAFFELETKFEYGCADFMLLTAMIKLGFSNHEFIRKAINKLNENSLPDGGFLCLQKSKKLNYIPKSCYKANVHALMFLSECSKNKIEVKFGSPLIEYFLNRNIFYKTTDKNVLVINSREGWRTIDTFYPFEVMRVGIQNVVEAFSALGYGQDPRLAEAWNILRSNQDNEGKILLNGTLTKSYLPKERVGKPSKWVTFYTLLAEKQSCEQTVGGIYV